MIGNMVANRRRSFKKRDAPKEDPEGVAWPKTKKGDRSSTGTNRGILAAAAKAGPGAEAAAARVAGEKNWRFGYVKHLCEHVSQSLESEEGCLTMARAGLDAAQEMFQFIRRGEGEMSMKEAMVKLGAEHFDAAEIVGQAPKPTKHELTLLYGAEALGKPYYDYIEKRNSKITGLQLREQLDKWVEYGTMERDVADALKTLQGNQQEWLDLSGMHFVLLGAASAMGPLQFILEHGGTVIAIARSKALIGILKRVKSTPGKVIFPVTKGTEWQHMVASEDYEGLGKVSGCDLMTQAPEIATWLTTVAPGSQLTIGNYTYLDGALHVQIAVACDCIMDKVCKARKDTAVAFLGTPTDAHVVTKDAADAALAAYEIAPKWMKFWESLGVLKQNRPRKGGDQQFMDSIVADQGPNYILSKRLQHWRAMVARAEGHTASSNVSPSTATKSVTSNASFAAAYGGMHIFKPMEVAYQELSLSLMGALLIHDLRNPKSAANPKTQLAHPLCLFQATSFHGGIWQCPYTIGTIGIPCAIRYYLAVFWLHIICGVLVSAVLVQYAVFGTLPTMLKSLASLTPPFVLQNMVSLAAALGIPF